ncbi:MAG TPA: hypothetical protein VF401_04235 [Candidatus Saccharimonadales bacterium]
MAEKQPHVQLPLHDYLSDPNGQGPILFLKEHGHAASMRLQEVAQPDSLLVIDFAGALDMIGSFYGPLMTSLHIAAQTHKERNFRAVMIGTTPDVRDEMILHANIKWPGLGQAVLACLVDSEVQLVTDKPHAAEAYSAAQTLTEEHGSFQMWQLGEVLGMTVPACHGRMEELMNHGAIGRAPAIVERGRQHNYQAVIAADLQN